MSYTLYGVNGAGSSIVEALLSELSVPYEVSFIDGAAGAHREPGYAAVNPQRKIPTLVTPEGETLTESAAILLTMAERHGGGRLLPAAGSPERARALRWLFFSAGELYPMVEFIDYPERMAPDDASAPAVKERADALWKERWQVLEGELGDGPFSVGRGALRHGLASRRAVALARPRLASRERAESSASQRRRRCAAGPRRDLAASLSEGVTALQGELSCAFISAAASA